MRRSMSTIVIDWGDIRIVDAFGLGDFKEFVKDFEEFIGVTDLVTETVGEFVDGDVH
jgi:hypothetical protein